MVEAEEGKRGEEGMRFHKTGMKMRIVLGFSKCTLKEDRRQWRNPFRILKGKGFSTRIPNLVKHDSLSA